MPRHEKKMNNTIEITNSLIQNKTIYEKKYGRHELTTTIELQAPDLGQTHKECGLIKQFVSPLPSHTRKCSYYIPFSW